MSIEDKLIEDSLEWKFSRIKRLTREIKARQKYSYYTYKPLRINLEENKNKYLDFHRCGKKIRILTGSPRSGKTTMAIQDVLWLTQGEHPFINMEVPNIGWVIVNKMDKVWEAGGMMDKFKDTLPMNKVKEIVENKNNREFLIEFFNGSKILFKSEEQGIDAFTSNKIHWALKDERIYNHDIRIQLRSRILDKDGLLIYTMDKIEDDEWVDDLKDKDYVYIQSFQIRDNPLIPEIELSRMETEFDEIDKERIFYGRFKERGLVYKFPKSLWNESNYVEIIPKRYDVMPDGEWRENQNGSLRVYKEYDGKLNYVMAWDVAEGVGKNSHAIQIFDEFGEQVAVWLNNIVNYNSLDEAVLIPLGIKYNNALAIGELRSYGHAVMKGMVDNNYPNLFVDLINKELKQIKNNNLRFGVVTDEINKVEMVEQTLFDLINGKLLLHDEKTVKQLEHFVMDVKEKSRTKSGVTYHGTRIKDDVELKFSDDDLAMALFFVDRGLNAWQYLTDIDRRRLVKDKKIVKTIDEFKADQYKTKDLEIKNKIKELSAFKVYEDSNDEWIMM